ncbi:MAG: FAD-dependent oxidoreductase [Erysipelotrichales bacterium]|nr:FAD-dependent oxidoreductase [Erysipelotrichales bacterium]MBQ1386245.1 FAD-dependent oxidoreductase [Erysipelotrichales bacterium]MBQ2310243.1 FAD-dependent oxidoreductase [Erysipelotrichales bacterium]MBQ2478282.1 FAD-dependent oxidoreductase [Erysipelotrichales bacterium]MBQ4010906.1 FAD-dependent oxidoreductase [Erysipelotrichales bacterium]
MSYTKLFEPNKLGNLELKNRIVMTPMGCSLAEVTGEPGPRMIKYYADRARGGAGLIMTEITRIDDETGVGTPNQLSVTNTHVIGQLSRLVEAVHAYDTKLFVQLHHPGNQTPSRLIGGKQPVSASDVTCKVIGEKPRALTTEEVEGLVKKFVTGAVIAQKAGVDGVEIHAAHGYLVSQFLSPHTNKRTDKYGGSFEGRMRFVTEIIYGIKAYCGPKFPISVRINGDDFLEDGITMEDAIAQAKYLEALGITCLNVSCGTYDSGATIIEPNYFAEGWKKHLAANIKKAVNIPVIAVCNIKHPAVAEQLLEEGFADYVGIARGHLADAEWGNKAKAGKEVLIRKCLGCMECFRILNDGLPLGCTLNPVLGREFEWGDEKLVKNGAGRTVAVIGGGPAGMEAALTLAKRGFRTILFEAKEKLGGTVNLAAVPPHKGMLAEWVETMEAQLAEAGVEVRLGVRADAETVKATGAEAVFLAAGGKPIQPVLPGIERAVTAENVLAGISPVKGDVVVVGGGVTGLETAETLAPEHKVTVVEMLNKIGGNLYPSIVMHLAQEIMKNGGMIAKGKVLTEVAENGVKVKDAASGEESFIPAETVVLAMGVRSNRPNLEELRAAYGDKLILVGDSAKPGQIYDALHCGHDRAFVYDAR